MCGEETASIAAGAPRGDAHIETVVSHSNDSRNWQAPQRRGGGDTRRFFPAHRCACLFKGVCLWRSCRRRNFVRQCSRVFVAESPLNTELPGVLKGVHFGAHARKDRLEIIES